MTDDHKPPVTSTPVGLIGVSDKDASGCDHKAEATQSTQMFARVKPCIAPGVHNFTVSRPPAGDFGHAIVVCTRCGMTAAEARS